MTDLRRQLQTTLGSAYTLERELGGGGMSRVFVATETRLRRSVVVKVLSSELAMGVSAERFEREIQLAASLQQANIVPLLSAGDTEGMPYYTMPFVEGESLRARLAAHGRLPLPECVSILRDLARALSYAHARGVVHRDIKPDNILLSHGAAMVTDFGIAKAISAARTQAPGATLTQAGTSIGTPAYMAPEQVAGDPAADHRVDLYAFGCVAHELLSGQPPFTDTSPQKVLAAHLSERPKPVGERRSDTPPELARLVMRCLEKDPDARPSSAEEIAFVLDGNLANAAAVRTRGVALAVGVVAVAAALFVTFRLSRVAPAALPGTVAGDSVRVVAVLPFENVGADSATEYLADGMTDELANALGRVPGLRIASRTSSFAFKGQHPDAREVGQRLGVAVLVEGSVQRAGDQLRVRIQVTDARTGNGVWTGRVDRAARDVFAAQDEVTAAVVKALQPTRAPVAVDTIARRGTQNMEAYDLFMRATFLVGKGDETSQRKAIAMFQQAIAKDPNYANAWLGMARTYAWMADEYLPPDESFPQTIDGFNRALAIDSMNADAHAGLAAVMIGYKRDVTTGRRELDRAFELSRNPLDAFVGASMLLMSTGQPDSALRLLRRLEKEDPLNPLLFGWTAWMASSVGDYQGAISDAKRALEIDPQNPYAHLPMGDALLFSGDTTGAIASYLKAQALGNRARAALAAVYAATGRRPEALALLDSLKADAKRHYVSADVIASVYAALGDRDAAFQHLDRAFRDHAGQLVLAPVDRRWDPLRSDPRFKAFLAKLGLSADLWAGVRVKGAR
jgi:serine/threonine-protein kinase